jgi:hypothetical protein
MSPAGPWARGGCECFGKTCALSALSVDYYGFDAPAVELEGQQGFLQQPFDGLPLAAVPGPVVLSKLSKT